MNKNVQKKKKKKIKNNALNTKVRLGTYFLCLLLTFLGTLVTFVLWLSVGLRIALSSGNVSSYLESGNFLDVHNSEALHVLACNYLKKLLDRHFIKILLLLLIVSVILLVLLWLASKKNAYVVAKFTSARLCSAGILMIVGAATCLIMGVHSSVKLINAQNTQLFRAYLSSSLFILIAFGVGLLAFAFLFEFAASSIARKRKEAYCSKIAELEKKQNISCS